MKKYLNKLFLIFLILTPIFTVIGQELAIDVVYPKPDSFIGASDSTFIFGSVTPGAFLSINGLNIDVHSDGGFLGYLPLQPGKFEFKLVAQLNGATAEHTLLVMVPEPEDSYNYDSLMISEIASNSGPVSLTKGDRLSVRFQGTPGCKAFFSIPDYLDSIPMVEIEPQTQLFWGASVFGDGDVPDTLKIRGIYHGFVDINTDLRFDSIGINYSLVAPTYQQIIGSIFKNSSNLINLSLLKMFNIAGQSISLKSQSKVKINSNDFPRYVEFMDSVQTIRVGPRKGYFSIFQPKGIRAMATGSEGQWLKIKLSASQYAWVSKNSVGMLPEGIESAVAYIRSIRIEEDSNLVKLIVPLSEKYPFRVTEESDYLIHLDIFGVNSDTDWIRHANKTDLVELASWKQMEHDWYRITLKLKNKIIGYDAHYDYDGLKLYIKQYAYSSATLIDRRIVVDPGHSADPGAIGPTRLTEAEANLKIALALRDELTRRGAEVIMTRDDNSDLPLYDRPRIAKAVDADLFISIHNNALPDGVNPFENNGISTYYYHPHSKDLAVQIEQEMLRNINLPHHGVYYGNLAVIRPTQYPAVLVECAFMIIPEQEALLKTGQFSQKIARSIRRGIEKYFENLSE